MSWALEAPRDPKIRFFNQLERFLLIILGFFLLFKKFEPYWNERGSSRNKFSVSQAPGAPRDPKINFFLVTRGFFVYHHVYFWLYEGNFNLVHVIEALPSKIFCVMGPRGP